MADEGLPEGAMGGSPGTGKTMGARELELLARTVNAGVILGSPSTRAVSSPLPVPNDTAERDRILAVLFGPAESGVDQFWHSASRVLSGELGQPKRGPLAQQAWDEGFRPPTLPPTRGAYNAPSPIEADRAARRAKLEEDRARRVAAERKRKAQRKAGRR